MGFDALISCLRRLSLCSVSFPPSLCLSFLCVSILRSPRLSSPGFLWFSAMMRQAPTARKVLLLALVLLLGCQGDGGSRLLGWACRVREPIYLVVANFKFMENFRV